MRSLAIVVPIFSSLASLLLSACSGAPQNTDAAIAAVDQGATAPSRLDSTVIQSSIGFGELRDGVFAVNKQLDGYILNARAGAEMRLEVTHGGSSAKLDTVLYVYGPERFGQYPKDPILSDNDSGWGKLSRIAATLPEGGRYIAVVGTKTGKGRGKYRIAATCLSGACEPLAPVALGACPTELTQTIQSCVAGWVQEGDAQLSPLDLAESCSDAEVLAPAYDAACALSGKPDYCQLSLEQFASHYAYPCARDVKQSIYDSTCTFGRYYREAFSKRHLSAVQQTRLTAVDIAGLSALQREQIVLALRNSAHDDVTSVEEAFARVDAGEIFRTVWWDGSARKSFVSFEYGAGDNSYGGFYDLASQTEAAKIQDGDLYQCSALFGGEFRDCMTDTDCGVGRCTGATAEVPRGICIDGSKDNSPFIGSSCSRQTPCPLDSGLLCAGESRSDGIMCLPAWMRGRFVTAPALAIPDQKPSGVTVQIAVSGLATVDMDVLLRLEVDHPRPKDLAAYLTNPAGTKVPIPIAAVKDSSIVFDGGVAGFSGDEQVNGIWSLRVVDKKSGKVGTLVSAELTVGSRWD